MSEVKVKSYSFVYWEERVTSTFLQQIFMHIYVRASNKKYWFLPFILYALDIGLGSGHVRPFFKWLVNGQ